LKSSTVGAAGTWTDRASIQKEEGTNKVAEIPAVVMKKEIERTGPRQGKKSGSEKK